MAIRFDQITVETPEIEALRRSYSHWERQIKASEFDAILKAVAAWDQSRRDVQTWHSLTHLRFNQDTRNEQYKRDREHCDELTPKITELDVRLKQLLVDHPLRAKLETEFGEHAFALWQSDVQSYDPVIEDETVAESRIEAEYNELLASAKLSFRGESYNHDAIDQFKFDGDRTTRHEAMQVKWQWFADHGDQLDEMFDRMVKLRDAMSRKMGMNSFIDLAYRRQTRIDYNRNDVDQYREGIRKHVVPVCEQLCQRQAKKLGVDKVMFWDEAVNRPEGNPVPGGDHDWMIAQAQKMFDEMGHGIDDFYRMMARDGYLDLKNREGKAGGGFCTDFPSVGMPFVFANFNGTVDDVRVFTHEMGHAFQGYSSRNKRLTDYLWPTYDACEIHSMSLEFLTFPQMNLFFGDEANVFCEDHLIGSIMFLPYGVAVDHFQHLVYEKPHASAAERHEMWQQMEQMYLPFRDYGDLAWPAKGGRWQLQRHIYLSPFYYIDYTLALTCALQFWLRDREDHDSAMNDYVALCQRGGEAPFQTLAKSANLTTPFDPDALETVMKEVNRELKLS